MMKGYFIHFNAKKEPGLRKKIDSQIKQFKKYFDIKELDVPEIVADSVAKKIFRRIPLFYPSTFDYANALRKIDNPDFVYIRRKNADKYYLSFLMEIKKRYPSCKVIVELPTYPYFKDDFMDKYNWPYFIRELVCIRFYKKYIDRFVTYSNDKKIFGVDTITIMNGLDINEAKQKKPSDNNEIICLIGVATFRKQHGYERLIRGLLDYKKNGGKRKIHLFLIGDGPEKNKYKSLIKSSKLEETIELIDKKTGNDLDCYYDRADIGVGALGMYKNNIDMSSSLKVREYFSRGLPVISGCIEDVCEKYPTKYNIRFPNDCSNIDIKRIIKFYDSIFCCQDLDVCDMKKRKEMVIKENYNYYKKYLTMDKVLMPVFEFVLNNKSV